MNTAHSYSAHLASWRADLWPEAEAQCLAMILTASHQGIKGDELASFVTLLWPDRRLSNPLNNRSTTDVVRPGFEWGWL